MSNEQAVRETNVGDMERIASVAVGGLLLFNGLRKRNIAGLGSALAGGALVLRGIGGHCQLYEAAGIQTKNVKSWISAGRDIGGTDIREDAPEIQGSITIGKSAEELYDLWRAPESLAKIMKHFADVTAIEGPELTHWRLKYSPMGASVEWDSELTVQNRGVELGWTSKPGTLLPNEGSVRFKPAPAERGTEVTVRFRFEPPLPSASIPVAKAFKTILKTIAQASLRHLKNLAETGEIPTLTGNVSGRGDSDLV